MRDDQPLDDNGNPDISRANFTGLDDEQKADAKRLKEEFNRLHSMIAQYHERYGVVPGNGRLFAISKSKLEEASMFAVKAITSDRSNK